MCVLEFFNTTIFYLEKGFFIFIRMPLLFIESCSNKIFNAAWGDKQELRIVIRLFSHFIKFIYELII